MSNDTAMVVQEAEEIVASPETGITGKREAIVAVQKRIMQMIPGAKQAPLDVVWAVSQISVALNLNPVIHEVYIGKIKGQYMPMIATTGYETLARRISEFDYQIEVMSDSEMNAHFPAKADERASIGVSITMRNYKMARQAKDIGLDYWPIKSYGFFFAGDNVPNSWTPLIVAEKRSIRNALKRGFSLAHAEEIAAQFGVVDGVDEFDGKVLESMNQLADTYDRDHALTMDRKPNVADDGMMWASEKSVGATEETIEDIEFHEVEAESEEVGESKERQSFAHLIGQLEGNVLQLAEWTRTKYNDDSGPCTDAQFNSLKGYLRSAAGKDSGYHAILSVLCGSTNTPSFSLASSLINLLKKTEQVDGKRVKRDEYRQDVADAIKDIWSVIQAEAEPAVA